MAVPTDVAEPLVLPSYERRLCSECGKCAWICPTDTLVWENGGLRIERKTAFGCIACGHCMAICPSGAIAVNGRGLFAVDVTPLPARRQCATPQQLEALLLTRRSVRHYLKREVEPDLVQRILDAAAAAPMGIPPSPVFITVVHGIDKVQQFAGELDGIFRASRFFIGPFMLGLMRPFMPKPQFQMMQDFIRPLYDELIAARKRGEDRLFYNAPMVLQFHTSQYADPQDAAIVATQAMLAAQAYGLGTCLIGSVGPMLAHNKALLKQYGIPPEHKLGMALIAGYPAVEFRNSVKRRLGGVNFA
jgi:nitroreductase/Pyruvate/2-oxoacid:ferredoxin oxidoreductase delta subunit